MQGTRQIERAFLLLDLLVLVGALPAASWLRDLAEPIIPQLKAEVRFESYGHLLLLFVPTWLYFASHFRLHRISTLLGPRLSIFPALMKTQFCGLVTIAVLLVSMQVPFNRSLILTFLLTSTLLLLLSKSLQKAVAASRREGEISLVMGASPDREQIREIQSIRGRSVEFLESSTPEALRRRLAQGGVDEVVIPAGWPRSEVHGLVQVAEEVGVPALVAIEKLDLSLARPRALVVGQTLYHSYETVHLDRLSLLFKSLLDRLLALVGLLVLSPLLALIALAIKLDSRGPVLFSQRRGGLNGKGFYMLKFRTMREGAERERARLKADNEMDGPVFKIRRDPRITRVGRWLRQTSMDELPQLLNVLAGHMSLVGPRPLPLVETSALEGMHRRRLSMRPGMTGLWQVSGRNDLGFEQWMALDLHYIDQWSLWLDLQILWRTVPAVVTGRGAS